MNSPAQFTIKAKRFHFPQAILIGAMIVPMIAAAQQVPLPPLDLGATSFLDGVGGPGTFVQDILEPYHASSFKGATGQALPGDNSIDTFASLTEVAYSSKYRLLGANYGGEMLLPIVHLDIATGLGINGSPSGVGDLIFSPLILQWPEKKLFGRKFFQRLHAIELIVPTGSYNRNNAVNVGSNVVSINPQYSLTMFLSPKLETSWRLHYLWNSRNNDPNPVYNASSIQPGQAAHFNASVSYLVHPRLRLGVNGYYLKGTTDARIGDHALADSRERIGALGPGLWVGTKFLEIYAHAFFEMGAENRPQGARYVLRIAKVFPAHPPPK